MSRRIIQVWCVVCIGLISSLPMCPAGAREFNWRQFQGTKLVVNFPAHVHYNAVIPLLPEFTRLTGIEVEVDRLNYLRMHDVQVIELAKSEISGDYDVVAFVCMWKTEYVANDFLVPLEPFFADPSLAVPGYDFDDLVPAYVDNTGRVGGEKIYMGGPNSRLYGLPFGAETSVLAYRKDLFDKFEITVPETYDELREIARFFAEDVPQIYGLAMRGASGHHATHAYLLHAAPFGANIFDQAWTPIFTGPESIETLQFMQEMIQYGPPGMVDFQQADMFDAFLGGKTAMYLDTVAIAGAVRNFEKTKLVGNVQYGLHPTHRTQLSETGGFGIGIPANSRHQEAAFLLLQWLTSKEIDKKNVLRGGAPFRMSTINDPEMQKQFSEFKVLAKQLQYADPDWRPIIPEWGRINEFLGVAIHEVLTGKQTPQKAMEAVAESVREIMRQAGYYDNE